jgi:hypothetical protein
MRDEMHSLRPFAAASPPSLRAAQEWLAAQILSHDSSPPACEGLLATPASGAIADRLGVHRGGYPARVEASVADTYPAVVHLVGAGALHGLVHRYARSLRRHSYNLNDVGADLPPFLERDSLTERLSFLPDLAALEWRIARAFHAFESAPFAARSLASWTIDDFESARLRFQPSVAVVRSRWPIVCLWKARETPIDQIDIDLRDRPENALVHRSGLDVSCRPIEADEADCLELLLAGETVGAAAARMADRVSAGAIGEWFARWSTAGLVTACAKSASMHDGSSPKPERVVGSAWI